MKINQAFLNDIVRLSALLNSGISVIRALGVLEEPYWKNIQDQIKDGYTFSEALKKTTLPLSDKEANIFCLFMNAGELGGVIEVVLSRYIKLYSGGNHFNEQITFLSFLGTLIGCGVPILTAIQNTPTISEDLAKFKSDLISSIKNGDSCSEVFEVSKLFPKYIALILDYGEQTGAFPEACLVASDAMERLS